MMKRLCMGLLLLAGAGTAFAQLGSSSNSAACCQLTTSLVQDVVNGQDASAEERMLTPQGMPANVHFLIDTSSSMRELPQISNGGHIEFFNLTTNGCTNPRLDAMQASRGWDANFQYPPADLGTGLGGDVGFPNLFRDNKFYAYMYWNDLTDPPYQWDTKEQACQSQVPNWNTTRTADYNLCLTCLSTKGYWKLPEASARDNAPLTNLNFILWGRFLNFNPPKYVSVRAALKQVLKNVHGMRVGMSEFAPNSNPYLSTMLAPQSPSCAQILADPNSFDNNRASYINTINGLTFTTGTPLAKSLLNIGYYFTSDDSIYRTVFNFGTYYNYPNEYRNTSLNSQGRSVCWGCQSSAVIILTDGDPTGDTISSTMATRLRTMNGGPVYCPDSMPCNSGTSLSTRDKGTNPTNVSDDNPNYYLDDVAKLLYEQDLQHSTPPVVGDFNTAGKQSLATYTIGFGINSNLLRNTAEVGGGLYFTAYDTESLQQALQQILSTSSAPRPRARSMAAASVENQPRNGNPASVLIPRLKAATNGTAPWQGFLYRFQLVQERLAGCDPLAPYVGDYNGDGDCDDTVLLDALGDPVTEDADGQFVKAYSPTTPAVPFWEASSVLKPSSAPTTRWMSRRIFTLVDTNGDGRMDRRDTPVEFTEANASLLREYLGISQNPNGCADLAARLGLVSLSPDDCAKLVIRWYRGADALNVDPTQRGYDRPFLLQDILHSTPISVEPPEPKTSCAGSPQCLPGLFSGATQLQSDYSVPNLPGPADAYDKYVREAGDRDKLVLVGSNGGMLHAFHNGRSVGTDASGRPYHDAGSGQEVWAFIPPDLLPKLRPNLDKHAYFVDGTPMVRDVWLDGAGGQPLDGVKQWQEYRTVAVVGTGRGGVHRFALDLTRLLGTVPGDTANLAPSASGDFLWMWPQPCDPLALQVGESFSNFAPQPPPIGPVALTPDADDSLRAMYDSYGGSPSTPWMINNTPARERWVVALNGGYDQYQARGRGLAMVDVASGHTVWSFFHQDGKSRSQNLRYSFSAGVALADVGSSYTSGADTDQLFDTATVGDFGGQLWTVRFWQPGEWDFVTQQVSNWHAARSFRVENLAGRTAHPEALRGPFSTTAANVLQPDTGFLRTFIGTGDTQNLTDKGSTCRLGNLRACAEQGCSSQATLEVRRGGNLVAASSTAYSNFALSNASTYQSWPGPSCASANVRLTWNASPQNGCAMSHTGAIEYTCDGNSTTWSCRTVMNTWQQFNYTAPGSPAPERFYGLWSYGGTPSRSFNTDAEANAFDASMLTDFSLVEVGNFLSDGTVAQPEPTASPTDPGWYLTYATASELTSTAPTVVDGCVLWNSFEVTNAAIPCASAGPNTSRLYQADSVSGKASCALGLYTPSSDMWSRYRAFGTTLNLPAPTPQRLQYGGAVHKHATLSTLDGAAPFTGSASGGAFVSLPVTEGPP
ncbi:pilus assembly protein PilY [Hyalangium versicolor]|uniref:pilus assembly protein PilY n=1 Tax=Hyalangium versicolor TaxID=2861190 RepID=UPI001CC95D37|nr:pilus assembly protein PilY [Hyalangium versicolor]